MGRKRIFNLLNEICSGDEYVTTVSIIGENTGAELYRGSIWQVPFSHCIDYVKSYEYKNHHLEIKMTMKAVG